MPEHPHRISLREKPLFDYSPKDRVISTQEIIDRCITACGAIGMTVTLRQSQASRYADDLPAVEREPRLPGILYAGTLLKAVEPEHIVLELLHPLSLELLEGAINSALLCGGDEHWDLTLHVISGDHLYFTVVMTQKDPSVWDFRPCDGKVYDAPAGKTHNLSPEEQEAIRNPVIITRRDPPDASKMSLREYMEAKRQWDAAQYRPITPPPSECAQLLTVADAPRFISIAMVTYDRPYDQLSPDEKLTVLRKPEPVRNPPVPGYPQLTAEQIREINSADMFPKLSGSIQSVPRHRSVVRTIVDAFRLQQKEPGPTHRIQHPEDNAKKAEDERTCGISAIETDPDRRRVNPEPAVDKIVHQVRQIKPPVPISMGDLVTPPVFMRDFPGIVEDVTVSCPVKKRRWWERVLNRLFWRFW